MLSSKIKNQVITIIHYYFDVSYYSVIFDASYYFDVSYDFDATYYSVIFDASYYLYESDASYFFDACYYYDVSYYFDASYYSVIFDASDYFDVGTGRTSKTGCLSCVENDVSPMKCPTRYKYAILAFRLIDNRRNVKQGITILYN